VDGIEAGTDLTTQTWTGAARAPCRWRRRPGVGPPADAARLMNAAGRARCLSFGANWWCRRAFQGRPNTTSAIMTTACPISRTESSDR
jgi:hypothetical protein